MTSLLLFADAAASSNTMRTFIAPAITSLGLLAGAACAFFIVKAGIEMMSSSGQPEKLAKAKKTLINAVVGLVIVGLAVSLTSIVGGAYTNPHYSGNDNFPELQSIEPKDTGISLYDVVIKTIVAVFRNVITSIGEPFIQALGFFTNSTPYLHTNPIVVRIWASVLGIGDVLLIIVLMLLGFQKMSGTSLGFEELDLKDMMTQLVCVVLGMHASLIILDGLIWLSNGMIWALKAGLPDVSVWNTLADITKQSSSMGLGGLLLMVAFLVLAVWLLVYYIQRIVALYLGAILSPLVVLAWLIPALKDFAVSAFKSYLVLISVLFVHVTILLLISSIFLTIKAGGTAGQPNALLALLVGLAALGLLLKAQSVMNQLFAAASAPKAVRDLTGSFMKGVTHLKSVSKTTKDAAKKTISAGTRTKKLIQNRQSTSMSTSAKNTPTTSKQSTDNSSKAQPLKTGETRKAVKEGDKK